MAASGAGGAGRSPGALPALLLVLITAAAYLPAILGGYVWDDDAYVTGNRVLREPDGLARIWFEPHSIPQYYPMVHTTFYLEHRLWGFHPLGYHLVNVLLHVAGALVLWRLLAGLGFPAAALTAFLFAVHPVHVESVAWITERKNVLSGLFYLIALAAACRFFGLGGGGGGGAEWRGGRAPYFAALLFFVFALLSKSVTATLPAVVALLIYWKRGRIRAAEGWALAPFFLVGIGSGLYTAWLERAHVGASGLAWNWSFAERCLIAGRALWFYAGKLIWPANLVFIYPRWKIDAAAWWQYLFPLLAVAVVVALWSLRRRLGRGPLAATLAFAATLFPALGFLAVYPMRYSFVADHFDYLGSVPILALAAFTVTALTDRCLPGRGARLAVGALLVASLALLTCRQCGMYESEESLWRTTVARNPRASMAHNNLGVLLSKRGRLDEAMEHVEKAVRIDPRNYEALTARGNLLLEKGMVDRAIDSYEQALAVQGDYPEAAYNLGNAYRIRGAAEKAIEMYRRALSLRPAYYGPLLNLSLLLLETGRLDEAAKECAAARALFPGDPRLESAWRMIRDARAGEGPGGG